MFKKLLTAVVSMALALTMIPAAFAGGPETTVADMMGDVEGSYDYGSNISFSLSLISTAEPDKINLTGDYYLYEAADSREQALNKLKQVFNDAKRDLSQYGKLSLVSISASENYTYDVNGMPTDEKTYNGYLNVKLVLNNFSRFEEAKDSLTLIGFTTWADITISEESKIEVESSLVRRITELLKKKKSVYEGIVESKLGKINSLYIDTWPDGSNYDSETGKVNVTVSVTAGYSVL